MADVGRTSIGIRTIERSAFLEVREDVGRSSTEMKVIERSHVLEVREDAGRCSTEMKVIERNTFLEVRVDEDEEDRSDARGRARARSTPPQSSMACRRAVGSPQLIRLNALLGDAHRLCMQSPAEGIDKGLRLDALLGDGGFHSTPSPTVNARLQGKGSPAVDAAHLFLRPVALLGDAGPCSTQSPPASAQRTAEAPAVGSAREGRKPLETPPGGGAQVSGPLPSIGSRGHAKGECRPCFYVYSTMGCKFGSTCRFCHISGDHPEASLVRPCKQKRDRLRRIESTIASRVASNPDILTSGGIVLPLGVDNYPWARARVMAQLTQIAADAYRGRSGELGQAHG